MGTATGKPSIETIIKDPLKHFRSPREVVSDRDFTLDEKRRILDSWALDAQLLSVAEEENMGGRDRPARAREPGLTAASRRRFDLREAAG